MQITAELIQETITSVTPKIVWRFRHSLTCLSQRLDIADLVQIVSFKAIRAGKDCRAKSTEELEHWVLTIAANTVRVLLRDNCQSPVRSTRREQCVIGASDSEAGEGFQPADIASDPTAKAEVTEEVQAVLAALDQLSAAQSKAIRLRYLDQLSNDEIASAMGISNQAVRCLLTKGLAKTRRLLEVSTLRS